MFDRYFAGKRVLDIGCGDDKIVPTAEGWDLPQGDGQHLRGLADGSFDVVFSSHFIEHLRDPLEGLLNQWRVLKPGGHLIFLVPDEDLYEQGLWPSLFNTDHKHTYTIAKDVTWSPASKNIVDLVGHLPQHKVISMRMVDTGYDYVDLKVYDQTDVRKAEAAVEVIVRKGPELLEFQTSLKRVFRCPKCSHMEFVIRGVAKNGELDSWCKNCGVVGSVKLELSMLENEEKNEHD
jgi:SAM-dependent methyltransferase